MAAKPVILGSAHLAIHGGKSSAKRYLKSHRKIVTMGGVIASKAGNRVAKKPHHCVKKEAIQPVFIPQTVVDLPH
jgi:hypothetical protein